LALAGNLYHATTAITTPDNELGWASNMQDLRDADGKLVFKTFMSGGACTECKKAGKPEDCEHMRKPHWKDPKAVGRIRAVLGDDINVFNREMMGTVTQDNIHIFQVKHSLFLRSQSLCRNLQLPFGNQSASYPGSRFKLCFALSTALEELLVPTS
jgi:hypothetical protein